MSDSLRDRIGWWTRARVVRWVDGDTLDVRVIRTIRIRLLGCNAPELHSKNDLGKKAAEYMRNQVPEGSDVIIHIPDEKENISSIFSFGRAIARVWSDDRDLCDVLNRFLEGLMEDHES